MNNLLDEFRSTSITWDKATRHIYSPITANASDSNGRKLNIQVVNSGRVENLTGATLHLYWETKDKVHDGLDAFTASDISKGEFELFYTTGMLSNVGELNATLVLVDSTGKVVSDWFKITVTRGINEGAIQSENSFSSLTQALIDISNLEQNYAPRLNDLTAQLQQNTAELNTTKSRIGWMDEAFVGVRYVAHRGYSTHYPENTLKAFYEASQCGYHAWEFDPFLTSDGVWVNMHDETVDRTTNGSGRVSDLTLAQIKALNIDGGKNAAIFKGLKVPTIEEIFELASQMEIKPIMFINSRDALPIDSQQVKDLANIVRKYGFEKRSILFMNDFSNWDGIRKELPNIGLCWDNWTTLPTDARLDQIASYAPNVMISFDRSTVLGAEWDGILQKCRDRGLVVQAQNVQNIEHAKFVKNKGVNSILMDGGYFV